MPWHSSSLLTVDRFRRAGIALLAVSVLAGPAAADRLPQDGERQIVDARAAPYDSVARVNIRGQGSCTGVHLGGGWLVTAAHCLHMRRLANRVAAPDDVHALFGFARGEFLVHGRAVEIRIAPGYDIERPVPSMGSDVALVRLERVSGPAWPPAARLGPDGAGERVTAVGFSRDRPFLMTASPACRLAPDSARPAIRVHDCDAPEGFSGGPLLRVGVSGAEVAGVSIAQEEVVGGLRGIAVAASRVRVLFPDVMAAIAQKCCARATLSGDFAGRDIGPIARSGKHVF